LAPRSRCALTVSPAWGVSAAPESDGPLGRAGPWAPEAADIERRYGADRTVHVSLEEFARTLTVAEEERERYREGGVRARRLPSRSRARPTPRDHRAYAASFRRFRAFDRPNVLHLYAAFTPRRAFSREFPEAVQTGPLWSGAHRGSARGRPSAPAWVWYASPASAERLAGEVAGALRAARPAASLFVRSPRAWREGAVPSWVDVRTAPIEPARWRRRFAAADVRIVTGSRTLLEALEVGGRFLYFNGVLGSGAARRRHRPEKLIALLALARRLGWPPDVRRDLSDFARGRRVPEVVGRVARKAGGWARPLPALHPIGFRPPFDDAGALLLEVARDLAAPDASADRTVARWRRRSNVKSGRPAAREDGDGRRIADDGRAGAGRRRARAPAR
jgi:hypothetical protein